MILCIGLECPNVQFCDDSVTPCAAFESTLSVPCFFRRWRGLQLRFACPFWRRGPGPGFPGQFPHFPVSYAYYSCWSCCYFLSASTSLLLLLLPTLLLMLLVCVAGFLAIHASELRTKADICATDAAFAALDEDGSVVAC